MLLLLLLLSVWASPTLSREQYSVAVPFVTDALYSISVVPARFTDAASKHCCFSFSGNLWIGAGRQAGANGQGLIAALGVAAAQQSENARCQPIATTGESAGVRRRSSSSLIWMTTAAAAAASADYSPLCPTFLVCRSNEIWPTVTKIANASSNGCHI